MLLLETPESAHAARIESAAAEAGLTVSYLEAIEAAPLNAPVIGVGPSVADPLQIARYIRATGARPVLLFFTASGSARHALQAELIRDPFLYPHFEIVELPESARQLASRMGRVVAQVTSQLHRPTSRRRRIGSRASTPTTRSSVKDEHFLAHILAHTHEAIVSTDEAGRIDGWNDAAQRLFGFKAHAALGKYVDFLDVDDATGSGKHLSDLVKLAVTSGESQLAQVTCVTTRGGRVQVAANVAPMRDKSGSVVGVSVMARDDSEYQRVQAALREANRQKDEFLAIMSHELRTPLTSILGYTDMLLRGLAGPLAPLTNKYIGNVRSAGDRLLELVNGLLDYTRLEAGAERLNVRSTDITLVIVHAIRYMQGPANDKRIDLRVVIDHDFAAHVEADEDRLTHVLRSFLNNAVKFTPAGGSVTVTVGPDPDKQDWVRVSVSDSGIGLRQEQLGRVWERFYQGDSSLTKPYGGMGLGLSIARHLILLHGGTVGVTSSGPGLGSTFWFSLPGSRAP